MAAALAKFRNFGVTQTFTAGAAYSGGDPVQLFGSREAGIVARPVASGAVGEAYVEGVIEVKKKGSLAISVGQLVYWSVANSYADVANSSGDFPLGICTLAAAAADTFVTVDLNVQPSSALILKTATHTNAAPGTVKIFDSNCPQKMRVVNAWLHATDNNAGTVKLTNGTNDITGTITHGTTTNALVNLIGNNTLDPTYYEIAAGGSLYSVSATGGNGVMYVLLAPVPVL